MTKTTRLILHVAIDTGGTFTDLSARRSDGESLRLKVPSTPLDPSEGIMDALRQLKAEWPEPAVIHLKHGTTVATNTVLEHRGARTALVTNAGFEDILCLGRQARPDLYAIHPIKPKPLVPRKWVLGLVGRQDHQGIQTEPTEDIDAFVSRHSAVLAHMDAVAISLLHGYADGSIELLIAKTIRARFPDLHVTTAHEIAPVLREFERTSTVVINAFVLPKMSQYLKRLTKAFKAACPFGSTLQVMGSSGSLLEFHQAQAEPIHTVLSGPAGGVRGAFMVGQRLGLHELLAVDMGGTSTDVAVIDGQLLPTDEGMVAHHPIRVPILPIQTVGAGGGSIAFVDEGGALRVGPRSAGALPGPACYGHGGDHGEATVTDANVVLGRLSSLLGGRFDLDQKAAFDAVSRLARQLNTRVHSCAEAIVAIAEANMIRACKQVIMDRGADPKALTLVGFGGATGLHGCALADALECAGVLFPHDAGVLSAKGILDAPKERAYTTPIFTRRAQLTDARFDDLIKRAYDAVLTSFGEADHVLGLADMRYAGQTFTLPVVVNLWSDADALFNGFVALHETRYGYTLPNRDIEWVQLRLFARAGSTEDDTDNTLTTIETILGPRIINQYGTTLYIPPGWEAKRLSSGDYLCTRLQLEADNTPILPANLGIEIHRQRLVAIAEEMGSTLKRAAFSANIKERKDYSCAIFDAQGALLCHAAHIPVHLGSTPLSVRAAMDAIDFRPGVSAILNDPYAGGTHLPDVTIVTPVFVESSPRPMFYVANRAHHADVGGRVPGSLTPLRGLDGTIQTLTVDDEGIRLPPMILSDKIRARFAHASRTPDERYGDLRAQEAANHMGCVRLRAWVARHDISTVKANNEALLDYSQRRMQAIIAGLPTGIYEYTDYLDDDGGSRSDIPIPLTMTIESDHVILDFSGAPDAVAGPLNAVPAIVRSAVFYCFRCLAGDSIPANEGLMRGLIIKTRPGSILDPYPPAAVAVGNVETSQRIVDVIFGALAQAAPSHIPAASAGTMNNVLFGGLDTRQTPNRAFVHYETIGGGAGGGPRGRGADGIQIHMTNTLNTPIEALERNFPVTIREYAMAQSPLACPNTNVGGAGIIRHYQFHVDTLVTVMAERRTRSPTGLNGAPDGIRGLDEWSEDGLTWHTMASKATRLIKAGGHLRVRTPSGAAWRAP